MPPSSGMQTKHKKDSGTWKLRQTGCSQTLIAHLAYRAGQGDFNNLKGSGR
jgi:hypothetical protein